MRALAVGDAERERVRDRTVHVGLGGEVDNRLGVADRGRDRLGILDLALDEADLVLDVAEVLLTSRVREGVQHRDLVAVLADAQLHERRADESGRAADEQLHAATPASSDMNWASPTCQSGSSGASRSEIRTLLAGRRAGTG